jgi:hypothetical protein
MTPMKLAEVRKHTGRRLTPGEAAQYVNPSQPAAVIRNPSQCAVAALVAELRNRLAAARSLSRPPRRQAPETACRFREGPMSSQVAQAFPDGLPQLRAALQNRRQLLGPVAYARHMHELDADEREARAILRRGQFRVVTGTACDE